MYPYVSKGTAIPASAAIVVREPTVSADPEQAASFFLSLWSRAIRNARLDADERFSHIVLI